jgi:hypothetical protein
MPTDSIPIVPTRRATASFVVGTALLTALGCGGSNGPERYAASGEVTLDGQPLQNASIVFEPRSREGVVATAPIVDGRFHWSESNGPTVGDFDVRVNPEAVEDSEALEIVKRRKRQPIEKTQVPPKYQRPGALTATVTREGPNEFVFSLSGR